MDNQCKYCGVSFTFATNLYRHIRNKHSLIKHELTEHNVEPCQTACMESLSNSFAPVVMFEPSTQSSARRFPILLIKSCIEKFPSYMRSRSHAILHRLLWNEISWDRNGQLIMSPGESAQADTNIIDFIYDTAKDEISDKR